MKTGVLLPIAILFITCGSLPARAQPQTAAFDTLFQHANNDRNAGAYDKAIDGGKRNPY